MNTLGQGVSGSVSIKDYYGNKVAVKRFFKGEFDVVSEQFVLETSIMRKLNHPYIMRILDASVDGEGICELTMLLGRTDLNKLVSDGISFNIKAMGEKIALGLIYLQNSNVFHGDIKPENIIIMDDYTPRISDFGLSVVNVCTFDGMWQEANTIHFKSPEMFFNLGYDFSSYPWVFGLLMYFMSERKNLFVYDEYQKFGDHVVKMFKLLGGSSNWSKEAEERFTLNRIPRDILFSPHKHPKLVTNLNLNNLINKTVVADKNARLSMFDVLRHPYFDSREIPDEKTCKERLDSNSIITSIPEDYHLFAEIVDRNQLIPYDSMFSGVFGTTMQLFCRFREKGGSTAVLDLAIPLVYLATDINTFYHQDINADWFDVNMEDVEEELMVDLEKDLDEIIQIQREVLEKLDYNLWFTTSIDYARLKRKDLIEARDNLM